MPALIVFLAGGAVMGALTVLGPVAGTALVVGAAAGAVGGPYLIGGLRNW